MVLIKKETTVNLNLGEDNNLGIFDYNANAIDNLKQSKGLRNLVFQIFRNVYNKKGGNREVKMKDAIPISYKVFNIKQSDLKEEDREEFRVKDYRKALKKFISEIEDEKLPLLISIAKDRGYLDENDKVVQKVEKVDLTLGQLGNEGRIRSHLDLPMGQMTDTPDDVLGTSLARAMMGNKNLAPPRDYKSIVEHIDVRPEGKHLLVIFRAKEYLHQLLDSNGYMASESTADNPVVRKGLPIPIVSNQGAKAQKPKAPDFEDEDEDEDEIQINIDSVQESISKLPEEGRDEKQEEEYQKLTQELEARKKQLQSIRGKQGAEEDAAAEDFQSDDAETEGEGIGEDEDYVDTENLDDEELQDFIGRKKDEVEKLLKATMGNKLDPEGVDPTGPMESILSYIEYYDDHFVLHRPDGSETPYETAYDVAKAAKEVTVTKATIEKILKQSVLEKKKMNPIQRLVFDSLQPSEGEITVKNYSMKLKIADNNTLNRSLLQLTEFESPDEFTDDQEKPLKHAIKNKLKKFLKKLEKFHELLTTQELKNLFYGADSRDEFIDGVIEIYHRDEDDEGAPNKIPEEDYRNLMSMVGMKTRTGKGSVQEKETGRTITTYSGKPSTYFKAGASSDSPFGNVGQDKTKSLNLDFGTKEHNIEVIIPRMRGITPNIDNFVEAIYDANFQRKPKDNKITWTKESRMLVPNKNVKMETVRFGKDSKMTRAKQGEKLSHKLPFTVDGSRDEEFPYSTTTNPSEEYEYSDAELTEMRGQDAPNQRTIVKLISLTEDIKQLAGKPLFVNFRTHKKQRKTTERDRTPKRPYYTEDLITLLVKIKSAFDKLKKI